VVDNNSVDGSNQMVEQKFPEVKLIANNNNLGFSAANNQAIKQATGEYILLLNPDTVVEENTFERCVKFMDEHQDAGALGVKMIDGNGEFLPESKRSLPTPLVAFYKIFGLSALFPRSKSFGKYHLGYLDNEQTHEIEVLAGAFMFIRNKVLDEIGLLDESYFMYGEDIDLSYRITQAGYKNYYYPETRIIHYKGESTKKSSINYVFVFYKAMALFAKKHFSSGNAALFSLLINVAIYIRAGISIVSRGIKKTTPILVDASALYVGMYFLKTYWEQNHKYVEGGHYPIEFMIFFVPSLIFVWLGSMYLSGGYDKSAGLNKISSGLVIGTIVILITYALLPETMRFSRALILLGAAWSLVSINGLRILYQFIKYKNINVGEETENKIAILGDSSEANRIFELLTQNNKVEHFIGFIRIKDDDINDERYLGKIDQLTEIISMYNLKELIFCSKDIQLESIINWMSKIGHDNNIEYKIAPSESSAVIGSKSPEYAGNLYTFDINLAIADPVNIRGKRIFDLFASLLLLVFSPIIFWFINNKIGFLKNIGAVVIGSKSWVGYKEVDQSEETISERKLPHIKKGVLTPISTIKKEEMDVYTIQRLNMLYAKNYHLSDDLNILLKGLKYLGAN